ncbi:hypothetical protein H0H87_009589 [Tephrocybe sp. NHM501043]|nr:hypothetical protein H0H87_009589 [Tephrocybe sp. NHM501043]
MAGRSREWVCPHCKECNLVLLPNPPTTPSGSANAVDISASEDHILQPQSEPQPEPEVPVSRSTTPEPAVIHSIDTLLPSGAVTGQTRPSPFITRAAVETPATVGATRKPPLVLIDGAISSEVSRRKSLQLPPRPIDVPIPPSLLESPYLNPQSIFQRTISAPHNPSEDDERWLQDTVPILPDNSKKMGRLSGTSTSSTSTDSEGLGPPPRPQSIGPSLAPPSPPIVRWRRPCHLTVPNWNNPPQVQSAPCLAEHEFFTRH